MTVQAHPAGIIYQALGEVTTDALVTRQHQADMSRELAEALDRLGYTIVKKEEADDA